MKMTVAQKHYSPIDFKFSLFSPLPNHIYYDLFVLVTTLKRTLRRLLDLVGWTGATAAGSYTFIIAKPVFMPHFNVARLSPRQSARQKWKNCLIWRQDRMLQR